MTLRAQAWALSVTRGFHINDDKTTNELNTTQKVVLMILAAHSDADGKCFPGIERISALACASKRAVLSAMKSLEDNGLIARIRRAGCVTTYRLALERVPMGSADSALVQNPSPSSAESAPELKNELRKKEEERGGADAPTPTPTPPIPDSPRPQQTPERAAAISAALAPQPRRARRAPSRPLPLDWMPCQQDADEARKRGLDLEETAGLFTAHWRGKGDVRADWSAMWLGWCIREVKFARERETRVATRPTKPPRMDQHEASLRALGLWTGGADNFNGVTIDAQEARR